MPAFNIHIDGTPEDIAAFKAWLARHGARLEYQDDCPPSDVSVTLPTEEHPPDDVLEQMQQACDLIQQELIKTEQRYKELISDVDLGILLQDAEARILTANDAALDMLGLTEDQLLGRTSFDPEWHVIQADGRPFPEDTHPVPTAIATKEPVHDVVLGVYQSKSGEYRWLLVSAIPQLTAEGELDRVVCSFSDITPLKTAQDKLHEEHELLTMIMNTSVAAITVVNIDGQITYANDSAQQILGLSISQIKERSYDDPEWHATDIEGNPWPDEKQPFRVVMDTGKPVFDIQHAIVWPDGERKILSINGAPIKDEHGTIINTVFLVHDITESKRMEDELRQKEKLRSELDKERAINAIRRRFMDTLSHEFRTPLTVITSSSDMLERYWDQINRENRSKRLRRIMAQVNYMDHMLDDLSWTLRLEDGTLSFVPEQTDVTRLVKDILEDFRLLISDQHTLTADLPHHDMIFYTDPHRLKHMLINLLNNAIKFSPTGGNVHLSLSHADSHLNITVSDEGIGIPEEDLPYIFEPYYRGSNGERVKGTGLGLHIVKDYVDSAQGEIQISSTLNVGTTFNITLPDLTPE